MRPSRRYSLGKGRINCGIGVLPVEFMRAAHVLGHEVVVIGVVPDIDPALKAEADAFYDIVLLN